MDEIVLRTVYVRVGIAVLAGLENQRTRKLSEYSPQHSMPCLPALPTHTKRKEENVARREEEDDMVARNG